MGENPFLSDPNVNKVRKALANLDFLVVQDIFLTETAELADVVLPAAAWAEKEGTFTATDRRVQRVRKAVEPPGEARADWEIVCDLGRRLAPGLRWDYASSSHIMEEISPLTPSYGGVSYQRLEECGFLQWPCRSAEDPGTPFLYRDGFPLGRARFHAVHHREADELPNEAYPFLLTTGRIMFHYHTGTMTRRVPKLEQEVGACYVEIHPDDARRLGLGSGGVLRVTSRRGQIEAEARVTDRVEPGVLFIPFHFAEAKANVLTNPALDPRVKIPEYKVCAVQLEAL
jgi:predicted molibdopterin-dependent oxidoreductase YjgC